jgi:hypothetical protein
MRENMPANKKVYFSKCKPKLYRIGNRIYSYTSHVATLFLGVLYIDSRYEKFSRTTSRHLSTAQRELGVSSKVLDNFTETCLFLSESEAA